ncbi:MAG: glycosyltransferase [Flavobacteriaceae bacterium]|nr:glycosyltransferase [Flavobacteriaceae bacterium]
MKTLIHIIPTLQNGGAENVLLRIVKEFNLDNKKQIVITTQGSKSDHNYEQVSQYCEVVHFLEEPQEVKRVLKENKDAKILAWMYKAIYFAHIWKIELGVSFPIIWNIRHSNFGPKQWYQKTMLLLYGLASKVLRNKIIYCSYKSKEVHEKAFFKKTDNTVIVNRLAKPPFDKDLNKSIENKKPFFLFVGRFDTQKGPENLREISEKIIENNSNIEVWIAGIGWDLNYFPVKIQSNIKLLGIRKDVYSLYSNAVGYLFTSTFGEGYPNVLAEASATGLPIIAFDAGDSRKILEAYEHGYIVCDNKEFYEKALWLYENPVKKEVRFKNAQKQLKRLDFSLTVKEYKEFISL